MNASNYPNGLRKTLATFSAAAYQVLKTREIDLVAKTAKRRERKWLKEVKKKSEEITSPYDIMLWAWIPLLKECPCLTLDILTMMIQYDDSVLNAEEMEKLFEEAERKTAEVNKMPEIKHKNLSSDSNL